MTINDSFMSHIKILYPATLGTRLLCLVAQNRSNQRFRFDERVSVQYSRLMRRMQKRLVGLTIVA
ncbi:unnamed protein product [Dovyalis caffra]|uniref:Uncharacterized protein n=1 Tax=Dovyalis caffra TaxID=77055 RepID=A0AAV1R041_9ROSI|nr:unnamed protein product [Dovyalis caffra]